MANSDNNSARIIAVTGEGIEAEENGQRLRLVISRCTRMAANTLNYTPKVGDKVRWKGAQISGNAGRQVNAAILACYA
jgi:hypothetical protein